ncbi:MAG: hypothetical protein LUH10_09610 [Tannerellaceae bacterium]|nr:hypothetical protein [Tannerellaceae bacterium]
MAKIEVIIRPLTGITMWGKDVRFGMSQEEVEQVMGRPAKYTVSNLINNVVEPRDGMQFIYSMAEDKSTSLSFIEIPVGSGLKVTYEGIDFFGFKKDEVVSQLSVYDTPTPNNGKYMNFYGLGICLGGYGRKRVEEKKFVRLFPASKQKKMEMMFRVGGGKMEE